MPNTRTGTRASSPAAITAAALVAVAFWSLKPIFITFVGDRGGFAEVYVASAAVSVLVSGTGVLLLRGDARALVRAGGIARHGAVQAAVSGLCLALWYYGFYRALYTAPKADATIIAFTWPLIAVIATPFLARTPIRRLSPVQWVLVLASFAGAAAIALSDHGEQSGGSSTGIVWAFVAAFGSGIYLPFALNATSAFDGVLGSKPKATFFAVSIANTTALVVVMAGLAVTGHALHFETFDATTVAVCALIGVGTYLVAELAWTWAFRENRSLALSSLPYLSPAVSVVLLLLLFAEPVRPVAAVGLVVIVVSNLIVHLIGNPDRPPSAPSRPAADARELPSQP